jgi:hypothetical protein
MSKKIRLLVLLTFVTETVVACDICGSGNGGSYIGLLPEFRKHIVGIRYRYNSLYSHIGAGGTTTYLTSLERYHTAEIWAGWQLHPKLRLLASLPYGFNERIRQGNRQTKNGPGDITVSAFYQLFSKSGKQSSSSISHSLWGGGGVKLPSGKYSNADKANTSQNTNLFQSGTGSFDFSLLAMYNLRIKNTGLTVSSGYKMNTANRYHYNYGNKLSSMAQVYYRWKPVAAVTVVPNAGIQYETAKKDIDNQLAVDLSGGSSLTGVAGIEFSFKKMAFGTSWQTPLSQNLANGIVKANNRLMMHVAVSF